MYIPKTYVSMYNSESYRTNKTINKIRRRETGPIRDLYGYVEWRGGFQLSPQM